jgi:hypothetical protein
MTPRERIRDLCQRYGVSSAFGERMLPLAERAEDVRPDLRARMHAFIERSFLAQAETEAREAAAEAASPWTPADPEEERLVRTVASVLHEWEPPRWLDTWARHIGRAGPPSGAPPA